MSLWQVSLEKRSRYPLRHLWDLAVHHVTPLCRCW